MRRAVISFASALLLVIASVATASAHPERACAFAQEVDPRVLSTLLDSLEGPALECLTVHEHPPDPV